MYALFKIYESLYFILSENVLKQQYCCLIIKNNVLGSNKNQPTGNK